MATITTVIPTYRRPALLGRAIESVLAQTYQDLEVVVLDDCSGDETGAVVEAIARRDSRVRYIAHKRNLGLAYGQAAAVDTARTPFFTILNDDDLIMPDFFATAMAEFKRYPAAKVFVGQLVYWDQQVPKLSRTFNGIGREGYVNPPDAAIDLMSSDQSSTWTSMMFRREVLDEIGGLDCNVGYALDLDFELRVLARYPAVFSNKPCAVYCMSPISGSFHDWLTPFLPGMRVMLAKFAADESLDVASRKRLVAAMKGAFRRTTIMGAARALTMGDLEPARRAAAYLASDLDAPVAAFALRAAAISGPVGNAVRAGLRQVKRLRRKMRDDSQSRALIDDVAKVLSTLEPRAARPSNRTRAEVRPGNVRNRATVQCSE